MKKYTRMLIVVLTTLITAGLFFWPMVIDLTVIKAEYLIKCLMAWIPLNVMAFSFYFKDKEE